MTQFVTGNLAADSGRSSRLETRKVASTGARSRRGVGVAPDARRHDFRESPAETKTPCKVRCWIEGAQASAENFSSRNHHGKPSLGFLAANDNKASSLYDALEEWRTPIGAQRKRRAS